MSKRAYGSGELREQGNAWYGRWASPTGQKRNRNVGPKRTPGTRDGLTKVQAERRLREMMEADTAAPVAARATVEEAAAALLVKQEAAGNKRSSIDTVESILRVHLVPYFKGKDLSRITEDDVERYVAVKRRGEKGGRGLAPKTIRNHLGVLHSVFALAERRKWCASNPVKLAEGPKVRRNSTRIRFLNSEELEALVRTEYPQDAYGTVEPSLYLTAAMTGLRQNELLALRWRHVDWLAQRIRVVDGYVRREFNDPKSEESSRSVPMATRVAQELERRSQRSEWQADEDLVFAHPETGRPLDASYILKRLKKALDRAGVRRVTFHELRHTFGTQCAAKGVPQRTLQAWMGHTDPKTTAIYMHYAPAPHEVAMVDGAFAHEPAARVPAIVP